MGEDGPLSRITIADTKQTVGQSTVLFPIWASICEKPNFSMVVALDGPRVSTLFTLRAQQFGYIRV